MKTFFKNQPYKMCPSWQKNSDAKNDENSEFTKFKEGPLYQKMIADVSRRLGFKFDLKPSQIKNVFDMCRFDQAWSLDQPSAWCAVSYNIYNYFIMQTLLTYHSSPIRRHSPSHRLISSNTQRISSTTTKLVTVIPK